MRTTVTERGEESSYRVLFFDDGGSMQQLFVYELELMEQGISLCSCTFEGSDKEYIVVGTALVIPEEQEPSRGRILVFEVLGEREGEDRRLHLAMEKETKGAVFCTVSMNGKLVAGIGCKVSRCIPSQHVVFPLISILFLLSTRLLLLQVEVYRMINGKDEAAGAGVHNSTASSSSMEVEDLSRKVVHGSVEPLTLHNECSHYGHILTLYMKTHGDYVLVGDLLRSVTLLQYKAAEGSLEEVARDFNSNYMRAVEVMGDDEHFLGADDSGNIFTVRRQSDAATDEMRSKMEPQGGFHVGDHINVFRRGSLNSQPAEQEGTAASTNSSSSSSSSSKAASSASPVKVAAAGGLAAVAGPGSVSILFGTISGAIGTIITLNKESYSFFSALERALKIVVAPEGGLSHDDWRGFCNERRSNPQKNMIDGDLVEQFLDLDRETLDHVVRQMNDDLATTSANSTGSFIGSTSSLHAVLSGESATKALTVEECTRRVEDMARLH
jgi:DNA damage-binding protein 1